MFRALFRVMNVTVISASLFNSTFTPPPTLREQNDLSFSSTLLINKSNNAKE